jgi:hypothetical protein
MVAAFGLFAIAIAIAVPALAADVEFLARVEAALTDSAGQPVQRVERDARGAVERLKGQFRARGRKLALGYSQRR